VQGVVDGGAVAPGLARLGQAGHKIDHPDLHAYPEHGHRSVGERRTSATLRARIRQRSSDQSGPTGRINDQVKSDSRTVPGVPDSRVAVDEAGQEDEAGDLRGRGPEPPGQEQEGQKAQGNDHPQAEVGVYQAEDGGVTERRVHRNQVPRRECSPGGVGGRRGRTSVREPLRSHQRPELAAAR
jgi:hypothetical protein